jgi:hypothetical protein
VDTGPGDFPGGEIRGQIEAVGGGHTQSTDAFFTSVGEGEVATALARHREHGPGGADGWADALRLDGGLDA